MSISGRILRTALYAGAGAAAAYFFDPQRGRGRRAEARDQATARLRRAERSAESKLRYAEGKAEGVLHNAAAIPPDPPADDQVLADRIRSELGPRLPSDVELNVVDLTAELRGEVPTDAAVIDLTEAVSRIPHVAGVVNLLHLPGQPAPNKADSLRTAPGAPGAGSGSS